MNRIRITTTCATLAVSLIAFSVPTHAASPTTAVGGSLQLQAYIVPNLGSKDPLCPFIGINIGGGTLTPFGDVTFVARECVLFNDATMNTIHASKGTLAITTAAGVVNGTYNGTFITSQDGKNYIANALALTIVGGTGAYAAARGQGTMSVIQSTTTGAGTITPSAWITY